MEFLQRRLRIATGEAGSPGPGRQLHNAKSIIEKCLHVSPFLLEACAQCPEALNEYQQSVNNLLHICNEQRALAKDTYDTLLKKDCLGIIKTAFQKLIMSTPIRSAGVLEGAAVQREKDDQRLLSEQLSSRAASQPPPCWVLSAAAVWIAGDCWPLFEMWQTCVCCLGRYIHIRKPC